MGCKISVCLFFLFCAIVFAPAMRAQQTYRMVADGNMWYEHGTYGGVATNDLQGVYVIYFFTGDTMLNNITYKKLQRLAVDTEYTSTMSIIYANGYAGAFRQDSLQVFFIAKDSVNEKLYCDFNLTVGSTLQYYFNSYPNKTVDSVYTVPFGNTVRKVFRLNDHSLFYDGIGYYMGLFHDLSFSYGGDVHAVCFKQDGIVENINAWGINAGEPCTFTVQAATSIKQIEVADNMRVFPNPFASNCNIEFAINKKVGFIMYNLYGQVVKQMDACNTNKLTIEKGELVTGVYFISLFFENGQSITKKLIIEN